MVETSIYISHPRFSTQFYCSLFCWCYFSTMTSISSPIPCARCSKATSTPLECLDELHSTCNDAPLCSSCVGTCAGCATLNSCLDCKQEGVAPGANNFFCDDCSSWYMYCMCKECQLQASPRHNSHAHAQAGSVPLLESQLSKRGAGEPCLLKWGEQRRMSREQQKSATLVAKLLLGLYVVVVVVATGCFFL